jgi:hypothetical protein
VKFLIKGIVLTALLSVTLFAREWNLGDRRLVEDFGLGIMGKKFDLYDPDALAEWSLETYYPDKYLKTKDDEFEFDSAKQWALKALKKRISMIQLPSKRDLFHTNLNSKFGKYDFKNERFPVKGMTKESYLNYHGTGEVVSSYNSSRLTFENADQNRNFLYMKKDQARRFLKKRNFNGYINREIIIRYTYTLESVKENNEFKPGHSQMTLNFIGKIKSMDIVDKKKNTVLQHIDFEDGNTTGKDLK